MRSASAHRPLLSLLRVHLLQYGRRLLAVREQSRLLSSLIGVFVLGYAGVSFLLFYHALRFVDRFPGLGDLLVERLMYLLFASLFMLLLFSNLVISYTNLFRNRETFYLLSLPLSSSTIFQWKFLESTFLASWAFVFLVAPLLAAYGLSRGVPWHFYAVTVALTVLFIVLPAVAGAFCAIGLARFMDRRGFQLAAVGIGVLGLAGIALWMKPSEPITDAMLETRVLSALDRLLTKTEFSQFPFLPSYWLSGGVLNWADGAMGASIFFGLILLSYVALFGALAMTTFGGPFYKGLSAVQSRGSVLGQWAWFRRREERRRQVQLTTSWLERVGGWLAPGRRDMMALIVKDTRVFWRDTTQWGQSLVLFGLLGVYIINLRHFSHQLTNPFWIELVAFLNLGACSLNLATLTTRFVFPQFSLEGKRLWIVGLAPLGLRRVVWTKWLLATGASLAVTLSLIWLSCGMLRLGAARTLYFAAAEAVMTLTLTGLAVGLGVLYPNFKEDNPSKIVSGFGGTFCLVLSFLYILASVVLLGFSSPWGRHATPLQWTAAAWAGFAALSLSLGWLPMRLAWRRLKTFEL